MISKKPAKTSTKLHKFSALKAEWKAEGSSELVVSHASLIMRIFNSLRPVSMDAILCLTVCQAEKERAVHGCSTICWLQGTIC